MEIFNAVERWAEGAEKSATVTDGTMVSTCVRLHKMSGKRLTTTVRLSDLVPDDKIVEAFSMKCQAGIGDCGGCS